MRRRSSLATVVAVTVALDARANAPLRPEGVRLVLPPCTDLPFDGKQLSDLLYVELQAVGVSRYEAPSGAPGSAAEPSAMPADVLLAVPECGVGARDVTVKLVNRRSSAAAERAVALDDVPVELRARALAIAVVELLSARWSELESTVSSAGEKAPPTRSSTAGAPEAPDVRVAPRAVPVHGATAAASATSVPARRTAKKSAEARPFVGVEAAASAWAFPSRSTALFGPSLTLSTTTSPLGVDIGASALFGEGATVAGGAAARWTGGHLGVRLQGDRVLVEPRIYLGYAWANGTPDSGAQRGTSGGSFVAVATLSGGVRGNLRGPWTLFADVEVGHTLHGVEFVDGSSTSVAGIGGVLVGARVGVSYR